MTSLIVSGTSYFAALSDIEPEAVTQVGYGCRVTIACPDDATREQWIDRMAVVACDSADEGHWDVTKAIYADIERNDIAAGRKSA